MKLVRELKKGSHYLLYNLGGYVVFCVGVKNIPYLEYDDKNEHTGYRHDVIQEPLKNPDIVIDNIGSRVYSKSSIERSPFDLSYDEFFKREIEN